MNSFFVFRKIAKMDVKIFEPGIKTAVTKLITVGNRWSLSLCVMNHSANHELFLCYGKHIFRGDGGSWLTENHFRQPLGKTQANASQNNTGKLNDKKWSLILLLIWIYVFFGFFEKMCTALLICISNHTFVVCFKFQWVIPCKRSKFE